MPLVPIFSLLGRQARVGGLPRPALLLRLRSMMHRFNSGRGVGEGTAGLSRQRLSLVARARAGNTRHSGALILYLVLESLVQILSCSWFPFCPSRWVHSLEWRPMLLGWMTSVVSEPLPLTRMTSRGTFTRYSAFMDGAQVILRQEWS